MQVTSPSVLRDPDRLEALRRLDLLEARSEPHFDHLASVVRQALDVPVALITMVDANRQFFVSCPGLLEPWASTGETPLSHSFCQHVVASGEALVIEDAREDPLVKDNLAIQDLRVVAYAGIPLTTIDGFTIGTLCAIDSKPRAWASSEIILLRRLASCVLDRIELRASARRNGAKSRFLDVAVDALPGALAIYDRTGKIIRWNRPLETLTGYSPEAIARMGPPDLLAEEDRPAMARLTTDVFDRGRAVLEARLLANDGRLIPVRYSAVRVRQSGADYLVAFSLNLAEREDLEGSRAPGGTERYRSLVEHATYGIYRADFEGNVVAANPALVRLLGYESEAEVVALDFGTDVYVREADRTVVTERLRTADVIRDVELEWKRRDGSRIHVRLSGRHIPDSETRMFEGFVEDFTERRRLEDQLRERQKLEAMGRVSGGVAHDFNNLLTVILAEADLALLSLPPGSGEEGALKEIRRTAERGSDIVRQLLSFVRRQPVTRDVFDLNEVVSGMRTMLNRLVGGDVALEIEPAAGEVPFEADRGQVEQVLVNLVVNGRDAMPEGGRLYVSTGVEAVGAEDAQLPDGGRPGRFAVLEVRDTGVGMSDEIRERAFEPFFTTKPPDEGTGLGLATASDIVRRSGGFIRIDSAPGAGTSMRVYLPLTAMPPFSQPREGESR